MGNKYAVPVWQFRRGAVIEFEVFAGKPVLGTVDYLVAYGARNLLAVLTRKVLHDGTVVEGGETHTRTLNLSHAKRVVAHSQGDVVFDETLHPRTKAEIEELRASGAYARRGNRVVLTWGCSSPDRALRILVHDHLVRNRKQLGMQPWEVVDVERMVEALKSRGVAKATSGAKLPWAEHRIDVRMDKLVRFVRQNFNRFKCELDAEEKLRDAMYDRMYREEQEDDFVFMEDDDSLLAENVA